MEIHFFSVIHEFAVLGTTCFLLALATLWYSPLMFGGIYRRIMSREELVFDETSPHFIRQLSIVFLSYLVMVALLAWILSYASVFNISGPLILLVIGIFVVMVQVAPAIYDGRYWLLFTVHAGFSAVFVAIGGALLILWPW